MQQILTEETQAFWEGVELRLRECAHCPPAGAACVGTGGRVQEGEIVRLKITGDRAYEEKSPCARYIEFRMAARLEKYGVLRRFCRVTLRQLYDGEPRVDVSEEFDRVIAAGHGKLAPTGIDLLITGPLAREHGAALFRSVLKQFHRTHFRSVHVAALDHDLKRAMTVKEPSPIDDLAEMEVLVLDDIDADALKNKWLMGQLTWLHKARRDRQLTTIITSTRDVGEAFQVTSVLKV